MMLAVDPEHAHIATGNTVENPPSKRTRLVLWTLMGAICACSVALRFAHLWKSSRFHLAVEVERAAASFAQDGTIADVYGAGTGLSAHVSPLYPIFLGGIYWLFGPGSQTARIVQGLCAIAATTLSFAILPLVGRRLSLSSVSGWIAAFVLAILPINLWFETPGDFEQPYSSLLLLILLLVFCRLSDEAWNRGRTIWLCGVLAGAAALSNPALLPFIALASLSELFTHPSVRVRIVQGIGVICLVTAVMVAPWLIRNRFVLGASIPFRSNFGLELAIGNNDRADGRTYVVNSQQPDEKVPHVHPFSNAQERSELVELGEAAYMKEKQRQAIQWMLSHPMRTAELTARRFRLYWFPTGDLWLPDDPLLGFKQWIFHCVSVGGFATMLWMAASRHPRSGLVWAAMIGPSIVYMITHVDLRYRYVTFALSTLLAVESLMMIWRRVAPDSGRFLKTPAKPSNTRDPVTEV